MGEFAHSEPRGNTSPARVATAKTLRATAVRRAIAHSSLPSTCSGAIVADTVYPCTTPTGSDTYTLTLPAATDLLVVRATATGGSSLPVTVTAPGGGAVTCQQPYWFQAPQCATTQAGDYTVQVQDNGSAFTLAYTALLSDTSCAVANPSFSAPTIQGSLAAGVVGDCYSLAMASGSVLHVGLSSTPWQELDVVVYDATGTQVCVDDQGDCTLTGTAPYRVLAGDTYGNANSYYLQLNSVSHPLGCLAATQQAYGAVPDTSSTVACRTLTVAAAGQYQVYAASAASGGTTGTLYHTDGTVACTNSGPTCQLPAGTYDFVADEYPESVPQFGVVFIAANESRGCTTTGDTDFAGGAAKGSFSGIGEEICLTLPTAAGKSDYMFDQPTADGTSPQMQVVDATGTQQCPYASFDYATCGLTGTAPFRAILSAQEAKGGYQLLVQRTDSSSGCAVWPQSGFGGSWGATVPLTVSSNVKCLSIPANQHSVGEMIDYSNVANKVDGNITVNDPSGKQVCIGASTTMCSYTPGLAYTALVEGVDVTGADTYKVVRRDVSQTAKCSTPASTTVGGPSTGFLLTSTLDTACVRITAAATDKIWMDARANVPAPAGAVLEVANPAGTMVCRQWGVSCQVTGSTSYQVIVIASNYAGITIPARVDTWRVGTAAGWAPQCTAHPLSADGFAPRSGSLTETSTAYCAVVQLPPSELLGIGLVMPTHTGSPWVSMYDNADWTNTIGLCNITGGEYNFSAECRTPSSTTDQAVMLVTPGNSPTPVDYVMQGVCEQDCATRPTPPTLSSVSPASGPAGAQNQAVVHGTGLNLGTELDLASNGSVVNNYQRNQIVGASPDGTSITVLLSTVGATPGSYDLMLDGAGYSPGTPSPGYLPSVYTVTAAPTPPPLSRFKPVTPSRILDTRSGLGAPKARVGAGRTVTLKVDGTAGVPPSGVTAVAMNVTEVKAAGSGFVTVYPDSRSRPTVSNLNFTAGQTIPNLVIVPVVNGKVDLYNGSTGALDLLADITGYYSGTGSAFQTVGPVRVMDTRSGLGGAGGSIAPGGAVHLSVTGLPGTPVPGTVTAVVLNVTVVGPAGGGFLSVFPDSQPLPTVSNLNFRAGQTIPNLVVVPVIDGSVDFYNGSGGNVQVLADLAGYYTA